MRIKYYSLVHNISGYSTGHYASYAEAECARDMLDDWTMWSIEPLYDLENEN